MSEAIPSWAFRNAKVVCVRDLSLAKHYNDLGLRRFPQIGDICVIQRAAIDDEYDRAYLNIEGYPRQGFDIFAFRPLVSQADDISTHFSQFLGTRAPELV